jgi:hypothetical protein
MNFSKLSKLGLVDTLFQRVVTVSLWFICSIIIEFTIFNSDSFMLNKIVDIILLSASLKLDKILDYKEVMLSYITRRPACNLVIPS